MVYFEALDPEENTREKAEELMEKVDKAIDGLDAQSRIRKNPHELGSYYTVEVSIGTENCIGACIDFEADCNGECDQQAKHDKNVDALNAALEKARGR